MNSRLICIAACIVLTHSPANALGAENAKPTAKSISLHQSVLGYQELLTGPPESVRMRSGLVVLAPGKSVGKHNTEDHEEIVIVLEGRGQMMLGDGTRLDITPDSPAYSPPATEHDVINTGSGVLRYIYVVSNAPERPGQQGGAMQRVNGLGGVFFKAKDPNATYAWYEKHLGIKSGPDGSGAMFHWRDFNDPGKTGLTVWSIFPENTKYFGTGGAPFMLNYRVDDLKGLLEKLKAEGVNVDPKVEEAEYGKFGWITDPEGNRIELWEPPEQK
jgi:mannose-6-phosphate isomerase-like protein (cupin superfamily)/catechol 2,3-dioxygenase-like lactoylglutathione lyase family enzyme